jgi:hypothetical protein
MGDKMMKNIFKITSLLLLMLFTNSCSSDFLDVKNINQLSEDSFYKTAKDFEDLIVTCYSPIGYFQLFANQVHVLNFAMDDRILHENFSLSNLQYNSTTAEIYQIYYGLFIGVFRTNLFLQKFTDEIEIDEERRKTILGEAHFFRALYYYYLATWFEIPPLLTEPPTDPKIGYPNATQEEIYKLVEEDFKYAIKTLPETWDNGRATKGAAMAFLGQTYLVQAKFKEAADILKELIDLNIYALNMPKGNAPIDYINAYLANFSPVDLPGSNGISYDSEFNSESIFDVNFSSYNSGKGGGYLPQRWSTGSHMTWFNGYSSITGGYGNIGIDDKKFPDEFETLTSHPSGLTKDPRYYATYLNIGDTLDWRPKYLDYFKNKLGRITFSKSDLNGTLGSLAGLRKYLYPFHVHVGDEGVGAPMFDPDNWRLMRYADVLLMYAEAQYRSTGNASDPDALNAINQVRHRVGLDPVSVLSKEAIIHERDVEFAGEHRRFWDLVRWYKDGWLSLSEVQKYKPTFQPRHVCFPIPLDEINKNNGKLKQNPKWE